MEVYPLPFEISSTSSTLVPNKVATAVAGTPQEALGSPIVIVGGVLYPLPTLVIITLPIVLYKLSK